MRLGLPPSCSANASNAREPLKMLSVSRRLPSCPRSKKRPRARAESLAEGSQPQGARKNRTFPRGIMRALLHRFLVPFRIKGSTAAFFLGGRTTGPCVRGGCQQGIHPMSGCQNEPWWGAPAWPAWPVQAVAAAEPDPAPPSPKGLSAVAAAVAVAAPAPWTRPVSYCLLAIASCVPAGSGTYALRRRHHLVAGLERSLQQQRRYRAADGRHLGCPVRSRGDHLASLVDAAADATAVWARASIAIRSSGVRGLRRLVRPCD